MSLSVLYINIYFISSVLGIDIKINYQFCNVVNDVMCHEVKTSIKCLSFLFKTLLKFLCVHVGVAFLLRNKKSRAHEIIEKKKRSTK